MRALVCANRLSTQLDSRLGHLALKVGVCPIEEVGQDVGVSLRENVVGNVVAIIELICTLFSGNLVSDVIDKTGTTTRRG